jgi:opacity protein-like surface antigen
MGNYAGETTEYYAGTNYGLSTGYALQAKARVGLAGFTLAGGIDYANMSNSGTAEGSQGKVEVSQSIVTFKVGPEFTIGIPAAPVTPYFGANVAWHTITGTTTFTGVSRVPSGSFDVESASRLGFGINGGVTIKIGAGLNLDLGAEYAFINPLTKEWKAPASVNRADSYKWLNDAKDPVYAAGNTEHFVANDRSISTLSFMATLMFGL